MIGFPSSLGIHLAVEPQDLRKPFNGLAALAGGIKPAGLEGGCLFAFTNKRRNRLKILYHDRTGVCIPAKRLETGTFSWPKSATSQAASVSPTPEALQLLFDGIDLRAATMRPWYQRD